MAGITKTELSARRQRLRDELPNHGWDYVKAGIAAGYSRSYARARLRRYAAKDSTFCQQVEAKRAEINATREDEVEKLVRSWEKIAHDETVAVRDRLKAGELLGKYRGIFSETRVIETAARQRELSEAERREAACLAALRFNTLPEQGLRLAEHTSGELPAAENGLLPNSVPEEETKRPPESLPALSLAMQQDDLHS